MTAPTEPVAKPLFLDTTIQVERAVGTDERRINAIRGLLAEFNQLITCDFVRLEFKRVVIQNLTCLLNYVLESEPPSFFAALAKAMRISTRRANTLGNILAWVGQGVGEVTATEGDKLDQRLATQSISYIRNAVMTLWYGFQTDLLHVTDRMHCQRAKEAPRRKETGSIDDTIHENACRTRQCNNANFFQEQRTILLGLAESLRQLREGGTELTAELLRAEEAIHAAAKDPSRLYNYGKCLELGDVWIHLECIAAGVKDLATFNYKESERLCPLLGLEMQPKRNA